MKVATWHWEPKAHATRVYYIPHGTCTSLFMCVCVEVSCRVITLDCTSPTIIHPSMHACIHPSPYNSCVIIPFHHPTMHHHGPRLLSRCRRWAILMWHLTLDDLGAINPSSMIGENRLLVIDGPVELEKQPVEVPAVSYRSTG